MIPVNSKYTRLFALSSLGMRIINDAKQTILSSASAMWYDYDTFIGALESYPSPVSGQNENTLLFAAPIIGGYALWQEDITGLNRLHTEIEASIAKLKVANIMLKEEEKVRRATQEEIEKTRLIEQLETEIADNITRLSTMIEQLEGAADKPKSTAQISLLLCYIKRRCNLFFREKEAEDFVADELTVYLDELAEIAGYSGVSVIVTSELKTNVSVRHATLFYDFFYNIIHWATWQADPYIIAHMGAEGRNVFLRMLPSEDANSFQMEKSFQSAVVSTGGLYAVKDLDDDAVGISLSFPIGGDYNG
jgi:hypothetical protein